MRLQEYINFAVWLRKTWINYGPVGLLPCTGVQRYRANNKLKKLSIILGLTQPYRVYKNITSSRGGITCQIYGYSRLEVPVVSVILECGTMSLGDWCHTSMLSPSVVEISTKFTYNPPTFFLWLFDPIPGHGLPLRGFAITLTGHTTLGKTSVDEWSVRHRDLYQHTTLTGDKRPCPQRRSKPQSKQASSLRPTP
jgi:hypothetical protein